MISIIVPVTNDADALRRTLISLVPEKHGHEVIVVDSGSVDGSPQLARSLPWVRLVKGQCGFPALCNAGAEKANGDILLFLPPGVILERGWSSAVEEAAKRDRFGIGCFRLRVDSGQIACRLAEVLATLSTFFLQGARSTQALFVRAGVAAGGPVFRDVPGLEDADLCLRHGLRGQVVQLSLAAINPAYRWEDGGIWKTLLVDFLAVWRWRRGESPERVSAHFGRPAPAVLVFVEAGKSKAPILSVGEEVDPARAAQIERGMLEQILLTVNHAHLGLEPFLFYHPKSARDGLDRWIGDQAHLVSQTGRTISQRRKQAVANLFTQPYERVLMLETHCPAMADDHLKQALRELDRRDLVVGPTNDGGCYLIGMKEPHPALFDRLGWTEDGLLDDVKAAATALGLSIAELPVLRDLDSIDDVRYNWAMGLIQR